MPHKISSLQAYVDKRVKMRFDNGYECIATLLYATQDMDGSVHLIYDEVAWTSDPRETARAKDAAFHIEGERLIHIEEIGY